MSETLREIKPNPTYSEVRSKDVTWPSFRDQKYWDYRKKWSEYPKSMYVSDFPLHLDLETTSYCNLECAMCPRTIQMNEEIDYLPENDQEISMDLYKKIVDESVENGLCSIKFQYLGEPLADSMIVERVRYAKKRGIIDTMFNTNATLLTEEMSHNLLEAGLDDIFFSVDSIIPSKFNKIRKGAEFNQVVQNIKNFMKIKNEGDYKNVQTRVSMVILPGTPKQEIDDYLKFWLPIVGTVGFDEWINHSTGHGEYQDYNPNFVCAQPFQRLFVTYTGTCIPCCVDVMREYPVGDINKQTIKEIWHDEPLTKLREAQIKGKYKDIDLCKKCYIPLSKSSGTTDPQVM